MKIRIAQICLVGVFLSLSACSGGKDEKPRVQGERIAVMDEAAVKLKPDEDMKSFDYSIAMPQPNQDWPMVGGNAAHNLANVSLNKTADEAWHVSIGKGSNGDYRLLASPVVVNGRIYTLDARGNVSAFKTADGEKLWRIDTTPKTAEDPAMPGGLAFDAGNLFVSTGFGAVLALSPVDGATVWRSALNKPIRSAPTVADGRVYVVTIDNELHALDEKTGRELWKHVAGAESATLMGSSSPAVSGDNVVVTYSSGEIYNLRAQTGRVAWGDSLATSAQMGALPAIADIRGLPVIDHGRAFAISHSGRMASIDLRTGERAWERSIGGTNTPAIAGNAVYVVTNDNQFLALSKNDGRIIWTDDLARYRKEGDRDSGSIFWTGPVMAGGLLWLANTQGQLVAYAVMTGEQRFDFDLDDPIYIAPVVAENTLFIVTDKGRLYAIR